MNSTRAKKIFGDYVDAARCGSAPPFDQVCAENAELAPELRQMHSAWSQQTLQDASFFDKLRDAFGDDVDPGISLDAETETGKTGSTEALIEKVSRMSGEERYRIKGELARGGMGLIYEVWDRDLRRTLAMKVVLGKDKEGKGSTAATNVDHDRLGRFLEEAQVTGQLDHPCIVPVHELGLDSDGRVYFTMRLIKGQELREIIEKFHAGKADWTLTRAVQIVQRVCESMAFAHDKGVVHRDLKPANIMVGRFGEVYVMDWGLAKLLGRKEKKRTPRPDATVTQTIIRSDRAHTDIRTLDGAVFGTPCYMAPEQARGATAEIGVRSDIYSMGSILYHILTGCAPFVAPGEPMRPYSVLTDLLEGPPVSIRETGARVPDELISICEKAMAREPEDRYAGMLEMAEDLQAFLEDRVVRAHASGAVAEFKKWVVRNKGMACALAGLITVVIAGSSAFAWQQSSLLRTIKKEQLATLDAKAAAEASEQEAHRHSYVANLIAADVSLRTNDTLEAKRRLAACSEELRGWEWQHVSLEANSSVAVFDHGSEVSSVAADPEFARIATGAADGSIQLWDPGSSRPDATLSGHSGRVAALEFTPDGSRLVSGSDDGTVRIWDLFSSRALFTLEGHEGAVTSIAISPDGDRVVSGSLDSHVRLWDLNMGREVRAIEASDQPVEAVAFAPDGERFASGAADGLIRVWSVTGDEPVLEIDAHPTGVTAVDVSPDGTRIASAGLDGSITIWDGSSGERELDVPAHVDAVFCLAFDPSGEHIVSGALDKSVRLSDSHSGELLQVLNGHETTVRAVTFSADGTRIVSGSDDGTARLWATEIGGGTTTFTVGDEPAAAVAFAPDGRRVAASSKFTGLILIWDALSKRRLLEIPGRDDGVSSLAFGPNGDWLVAGLEESSTVAIFDSRTGALRLDPMVGHDASVSAVAASPDGSLIASASADQTVRIWRSSDGEALATLTGHEMPATSVAFSPDATQVVAGAFDGSVRTWNTTGGDPRLVIEAHPDAVRSVAFSLDGTLIATASHDETIGLWDAATGREAGSLAGHDGAVYAIAFSPDGTRLVSSSFDKTLLVWDMESKTPLLTLRGHLAPVAATAFSADGKRIASGAFDGTVTIWETTSAADRFSARTAADLVETQELGLGNLELVREFLEADWDLDDSLRRAALEFIELRGESND